MGLPTHRSEVSCQSPCGVSPRGSALVDVPEEPRTSNCGVRLSRYGDLWLPASASVGGDGARQPTAYSLRRDSPTDGLLDASAATRGSRVRDPVPVSDP